MSKQLFYSKITIIQDDIVEAHETYLKHKLKEKQGDGSCYFWQHTWNGSDELDKIEWHVKKIKRNNEEYKDRKQIVKSRECRNCGKLEVFLRQQTYWDVWNCNMETNDGNIVKEYRKYRKQEEMSN